MRSPTDMARSAAPCRFGGIASQGSYARATSGDDRGPPKQYTETSTRSANWRLRYSTWTPAPPYTSGGNSRVSRPTFTIGSLAVDDRALAEHDHALVRTGKAAPVAFGIDTY